MAQTYDFVIRWTDILARRCLEIICPADEVHRFNEAHSFQILSLGFEQ
jgi:hypothetical protein